MRSRDASLHEPILRALAYFSLWGHPLTLDEIERYLCVPARLDDVQDALFELLESEMVAEQGGFYFLPGRGSVIDRRAGQSRAHDARQAVVKHVTRISKFPFVRTICLTGSYAKHVLAPGADIDYLIVTEPGRLWITRTLLILYKKIVLKNSFQFFCLNYFVDTDHLRFNDRTIYTAIELASMLPAYGMKHYYRCWSANEWLHSILPNARALPVLPGIHQKDGRIKRLIEGTLQLRIFDRVERFLMNLTHRTWQRRFPLVPQRKRDILFATTPHVSRHHPVDYNEMVPRMVEQVLEGLPQERFVRV